MGLDASIPFMSYNAAQDRKKLALANRQVDAQEKAAAQKGMDIDTLADQALLKMQMGQPLDPVEQAGLEAWNTKRQTEMTPDMEGNLYPSKRSIFDLIGQKAGKVGSFNPAADNPASATPGRASIGDKALEALYPGSPAPDTKNPARMSIADLAGIPKIEGAALEMPNPNKDTLPQPDTTGMSPYRQKEAFTKTNDANTDLQKTKAQNQVPGMATREGYVPSADDAKTTKEVQQAVDMIESLTTDYLTLLEKTPNPVAGTAEALKIEQMQGQIGAQVKALETLGAYDSGVQALMKQMLGNPVIAGGTTMDIAMNPFKAVSTTWTKADTERARGVNRANVGQFRKYAKEKLKTTAGARGFETPKFPASYEGKRVKNSKTGEIGTVRNGQWTKDQ